MKNTIFGLLALSAILSVQTARPQWVQQTSPTSSKLEGLYFTDANTGYTSGTFLPMYKTTNGGQSWTSLGSYAARDIWFVDANNGYATAAAGATNGTMKKTTNAGTTWTAITPPNSSAYLGVCPTSLTTCYFINTENKVIKTVNGGTTVTSYTLPVVNSGSNAVTDIFFSDANTGFVSCQGGQAFKTTNAGASWTALTLGVTNSFNSVYFVNATTGYLAGNSGRILKTTDAGVTWTDKSLGISSHIQAIKFSDVNNGIAVCLVGKIYRTADGGDTWIEQASGTTQHLRNVFYLTPTSAVIVGEAGTILKNTNVLATEGFAGNSEIKLYPNPLRNHSVLSIDNFENLRNPELEIYSVSGQLLRKASLTSGEYQLDKADFASGVYLLKVKSADGLLKVLQFIAE